MYKTLHGLRSKVNLLNSGRDCRKALSQVSLVALDSGVDVLNVELAKDQNWSPVILKEKSDVFKMMYISVKS